MSNIKKITEQTIARLEAANIEITPEAYAREFCNISQSMGLINEQCELFTNALLDLTQEELDANEGKKLSTIYDLIDILLQRPHASKLAEQTTDVVKLVKLMDTHLDDAINSSNNGYITINSIKENIKSSNTNGDLNSVKEKLINATTIIEKEISSVGQKLQDGKNEINILESKINALEKDLNKYKNESRIDHLTGLLIRRAYEEEVSKFEDMYVRQDHNYAIVFFDLDDFKKVNDTYGHDCGDSVLKTFGKILSKLTRKTDVVARYGGEEFIAVVNYNKEKELIKYLKRLKDIVVNNKFVHNDLKLNITFSAGVDIRSSHKTYNATIQQADVLLYEAKNSGKNKIVFGSGTVV